MKKILSLLLVFLMITSTFAIFVSADFVENPDGSETWIPTKFEWTAVEKGSDVVARFVIGADIHMDHYNSYEKLQSTYDVSKTIGGVDSLMICGDLTHYGKDSEYAPLMEVINNNTKQNNFANPNATGDAVESTILIMGNHDFGHTDNNNEVGPEDFTRNTGMDACALYWINGVPVIALSPYPERGPTQSESTEIGNNYDGRLEWLTQTYATIDNSGWDGPIIVIAHHRTPNNADKIFAGTANRNAYYPTEMLQLFKDHPETIIFTGHSHTWIGDTQEFIVQNNNGFTQVRAGSLGNNYGETDGQINASTGLKESGLRDSEHDINCSAVLVDVMADGTTKLRPIDVAKGEYIYGDYEFVVDADEMGYYNRKANEGTFAYGSAAPVFAADAASQISVEDLGNNSSVQITFPTATPASDHPRDAIDYYFIELKDANGNIINVDGEDYLKVGNYRHESKEGQPFTVKVNSLGWDTDYTLSIWAESAYGTKSQVLVYSEQVNIGHGTPTYPAKPVYDIDFSYGNKKDAQGHAILEDTNILSTIEDDATIDQKAMNLFKFAQTSICYDFQDADYRRIQNGYTLECFFSASNIITEQALVGAWTGTRLGLKIEGGKLIVYAQYLSRKNTETARTIVTTNISSNTWYHALVVYDGIKTDLYLNGTKVATADQCNGGLVTSYSEPSDDPEQEDAAVANERIRFCVGAFDNSTDGEMYPVMSNTRINKVALYEGIMDADDAALAYKIAKENPGFTDVADTWYTDSVEYARAAGLMSGTNTAKTTFEPETATSRAMIVQLLYALEGSPDVEYKSTFTDVKANNWFADAVIWANDNGIAYGSGGKFDPNGLVTREQVAAFLYRYLKDYKQIEMEPGADLSIFPDEDEISSYGDLRDAVAWANAVGIVNGKAKNGGVYLAPQDKATRAETATMITNFHKRFA